MTTTPTLSRMLLSTLALGLGLTGSALADVIRVPTDFNTIQEAVNAASDGDAIQVKSGHYIETVLIQTSGITLRGHGATIDAEYEGPCVEIVASDVVLDGLTLINGTCGVLADGDRIAIQRCTATSAAESGFRLQGDDAVVTRSTVLGAIGAGISFEANTDSSTSLFEKNTLAHGDGAPIYAEGGRIIATRNRCTLLGSAMEIHPTHLGERSLVSKNSIERTDDYGIYTSVKGAGIVIEKNDLRFTGSSGLDIYCDDASQITLRANTIEDSGSTGIYAWIKHEAAVLEIEGNTVRGANSEGIEVDSEVMPPVIVDNVIEDVNEEGIDARFDGGLIRGNRIRRTGLQGIRVQVADEGGSGGTTVDDNDVRFAALDGLLVFGNNNVVRGNRVRRCMGDGIDLRSGVLNVVEDNIVLANAHEGIDNSMTWTLIDGNTAKKNGSGLGPDIAGRGKSGVGSTSSFVGNTFGTGGADTLQRNDPPN